MQITRSSEPKTTVVTNDLHDALMRKSGRQFWKIWKSKFESKTNGKLIDLPIDLLSLKILLGTVNEFVLPRITQEMRSLKCDIVV
jgi:hypothetical protein